MRAKFRVEIDKAGLIELTDEVTRREDRTSVGLPPVVGSRRADGVTSVHNDSEGGGACGRELRPLVPPTLG